MNWTRHLFGAANYVAGFSLGLTVGSGNAWWMLGWVLAFALFITERIVDNKELEGWRK